MNARALVLRPGLVGRPIALALASLWLAAACAPTFGGLGPVPTSPPTAIPSAASTVPDVVPGPTPATAGPALSAAPTGAAAIAPTGTGQSIVRAYFRIAAGQDGEAGQAGAVGLVPVLRSIPATRAVAAAAMAALLAGPAASEAGATPAISTSVPAGSTLLGLTIDGGVATVNLSDEFETGGGTTDSRTRLAQVVYTLTQFPSVTAVRFQLDGRTPTVFGGQGVVLDGPVGRADFTDQLPAIFVDRPAFAATIGNPARIAGTADVFEARFRLAIVDGDGRTIAERAVSATCGSGCRGTFDVTVPYVVAAAGWGSLRVWEPSARDGSPTNVRTYPAYLTPGS